MICLLIRDLGEVGDGGVDSDILRAGSESPILHKRICEKEGSCAGCEPVCLHRTARDHVTSPAVLSAYLCVIVWTILWFLLLILELFL